MTAIINDFASIRSAVDGAPEGDAAILAKFREWCAAARYAETIGDDFASEPAYDEACTAAWKIEEHLVETPASGPIGLAIKVYLRHKNEHQRAARLGRDPCKLCVPVKGERDGIVAELEESTLRDAIRFVPELAPFCAAVLEEREDEAEQPSVTADPPALPATGDGTDDPLVDAEQKLTSLWAEHNAAMGEDGAPVDPLWDRIWPIEDMIRATAPVTLAGAGVKLRRLLDPDIGIETANHGNDVLSLRQVLALIEREARS